MTKDDIFDLIKLGIVTFLLSIIFSIIIFSAILALHMYFNEKILYFNEKILQCDDIKNKIELHKQVPLTAQEAIHAKRTTA